MSSKVRHLSLGTILIGVFLILTIFGLGLSVVGACAEITLKTLLS